MEKSSQDAAALLTPKIEIDIAEEPYWMTSSHTLRETNATSFFMASSNDDVDVKPPVPYPHHITAADLDARPGLIDSSDNSTVDIKPFAALWHQQHASSAGDSDVPNVRPAVVDRRDVKIEDVRVDRTLQTVGSDTSDTVLHGGGRSAMDDQRETRAPDGKQDKTVLASAVNVPGHELYGQGGRSENSLHFRSGEGHTFQGDPLPQKTQSTSEEVLTVSDALSTWGEACAGPSSVTCVSGLTSTAQYTLSTAHASVTASSALTACQPVLLSSSSGRLHDASDKTSVFIGGNGSPKHSVTSSAASLNCSLTFGSQTTVGTLLLASSAIQGSSCFSFESKTCTAASSATTPSVFGSKARSDFKFGGDRGQGFQFSNCSSKLHDDPSSITGQRFPLRTGAACREADIPRATAQSVADTGVAAVPRFTNSGVCRRSGTPSTPTDVKKRSYWLARARLGLLTKPFHPLFLMKGLFGDGSSSTTSASVSRRIEAETEGPSNATAGLSHSTGLLPSNCVPGTSIGTMPPNSSSTEPGTLSGVVGTSNGRLPSDSVAGADSGTVLPDNTAVLASGATLGSNSTSSSDRRTLLSASSTVSLAPSNASSLNSATLASDSATYSCDATVLSDSVMGSAKQTSVVLDAAASSPSLLDVQTERLQNTEGELDSEDEQDVSTCGVRTSSSLSDNTAAAIDACVGTRVTPTSSVSNWSSTSVTAFPQTRSYSSTSLINTSFASLCAFPRTGSTLGWFPLMKTGPAFLGLKRSPFTTPKPNQAKTCKRPKGTKDTNTFPSLHTGGHTLGEDSQQSEAKRRRQVMDRVRAERTDPISAIEKTNSDVDSCEGGVETPKQDTETHRSALVLNERIVEKKEVEMEMFRLAVEKNKRELEMSKVQQKVLELEARKLELQIKLLERKTKNMNKEKS